ncbi:MAG: hypothetical protein PHG61_02085 [Candidatus Marinimicrobia bacterium]|jgi:hypothetical protein|nr:hypothetical protein [Candidatus Neomarinimicrobiota bacterium]
MIFVTQISINGQPEPFHKGIVADNLQDAKLKAESYAKTLSDVYQRRAYFLPAAGKPLYTVDKVVEINSLEEIAKIISGG